MDFEANRRKILSDIRQAKLRKKASAYRGSKHHINNEQIETEKKAVHPPLVVFGEKGLFVNNLISSLTNSAFQVKRFFDVDKTVDYMLENGIQYVLIDIDPPSDYHQAVNLLSVVRSLITDACMIIYTKDIHDSRARSLEDHGGTILEKPFSLQDLFHLLSGDSQ